MDDVVPTHQSRRWFLEDVPLPDADAGRQPGLWRALADVDVVAVELRIVDAFQLLAKLKEPNPATCFPSAGSKGFASRGLGPLAYPVPQPTSATRKLFSGRAILGLMMYPSDSFQSMDCRFKLSHHWSVDEVFQRAAMGHVPTEGQKVFA